MIKLRAAIRPRSTRKRLANLTKFSATTDGGSLAPSRVLRKPAQHEPMPDFDMQSLEEVKRSVPKKYSDAELYKLSTLFPEPKDQSRQYTSDGTTAVDRNPFRKPSY